jgi:predicted PurR-regulated permease PerM
MTTAHATPSGPAPRSDVFRTVLLIALIGGLIGLSLWLLRPFIPAIVWATAIVVSTWPLLIGAQQRLFGKRWMATAVMTLAMLLVFVIPLTLAIGTIVRHADKLESLAGGIDAAAIETPPAWVAGLPLVGPELDSAWRKAGEGGQLGEKLKPHLGAVAKWFVAQLGGFGVVAVQILLTIVLSAVLYMHGEKAAGFVLALARRVGGEQGEGAVRLAGQAIRGVALGVVVTALVQAALGGIGLGVAGVPMAAVLTAVMFLLAVAQVGAVPVLACAVIWLYARGDTGWATALLVWTVIVGSLDNVLRPILIRRGADLPLLLIFAGVVGGLLTFGLVGIFIGPIVLAVTWTLCSAWVAGPEAAQAKLKAVEAGRKPRKPAKTPKAAER